MCQNLADGRSVHRIGLEHARDQVLECIRKPVGAVHVVVLPEAFLVTVLDLLEQRIVLGIGQSEGELPRNHRKQKHSDCKEVGWWTSIATLALSDLRSHVPLCADNALLQPCTVLAADGTSEPKVCNLQVEILVQQQILGLQISVSNALKMAVIEAFEQLLHVIAGDRLTERTRLGDIVVEATSICKLHDHEIDLLLRDQLVVGRLLVFAVRALDLLENVLVFQILHDGHLLSDSLAGQVRQGVLQNLDGYLAVRLALAQLDFAGASGAKRVENGVLTDLLLLCLRFHSL